MAFTRARGIWNLWGAQRRAERAHVAALEAEVRALTAQVVTLAQTVATQGAGLYDHRLWITSLLAVSSVSRRKEVTAERDRRIAALKAAVRAREAPPATPPPLAAIEGGRVNVRLGAAKA